MKKITLGILMFTFVTLLPIVNIDAKEEKKEKSEYEVPSHVLTISKENTFPNTSEDQEVIEPSELTKELIDALKLKIENPSLIKLLNETTLKPSPISFGYRGLIYLGRWPLNYESDDTTVNWEYQQINLNELNNLGGTSGLVLSYHQLEQKEVKGALTNKVTNAEDVRNMILLKAKQKTKLPLSFQAMIGKGTRKDNTYNIPAKKYGYLKAHAPAVNEKGQVTFGEVYIELKGTKKSIVIKNVTKQGIGAWIPIQDHISFSFQLKE